MKTTLLTHKRLLEVVKYHRHTGVFYWKVSTGKVARGAAAGHTDSNGYTKISIDSVKYFAHRLAWFYVHREWPKKNIDHINLCKSDNRIVNLRDVGQSVNGINGPIRRNNSSGYTGVSYDKRRGNWVAYTHQKFRKKHLGAYETLAGAALARQKAVAEIFSLLGK